MWLEGGNFDVSHKYKTGLLSIIFFSIFTLLCFISGAYLLYISWSDRQVKGSPFKVNVISSSDASRVVASGEGLKMGVMGQEIKSVIDTRRAGPGKKCPIHRVL